MVETGAVENAEEQAVVASVPLGRLHSIGRMDEPGRQRIVLPQIIITQRIIHETICRITKEKRNLGGSSGILRIPPCLPSLATLSL
jgi:hypothetical protein